MQRLSLSYIATFGDYVTNFESITEVNVVYITRNYIRYKVF